MVDRIFRVPPQENPQVDRIKDDEQKKQQNPEDEEDEGQKKRVDAFDPKKQGPAHDQLLHTKQTGVPQAGYFARRNLDKKRETGLGKNVSADEMQTVIEQKEKTFSQTLK